MSGWVGGPITEAEMAAAVPVEPGDALLYAGLFLVVESISGSTIWCRSESGTLVWISRSNAIAGKVLLTRVATNDRALLRKILRAWDAYEAEAHSPTCSFPPKPCDCGFEALSNLMEQVAALIGEK